MLAGLKKGNDALKKLNALMQIDDVEKILSDAEEAQEYQEVNLSVHSFINVYSHPPTSAKFVSKEKRPSLSWEWFSYHTRVLFWSKTGQKDVMPRPVSQLLVNGCRCSSTGHPMLKKSI